MVSAGVSKKVNHVECMLVLGKIQGHQQLQHPTTSYNQIQPDTTRYNQINQPPTDSEVPDIFDCGIDAFGAPVFTGDQSLPAMAGRETSSVLLREVDQIR